MSRSYPIISITGSSGAGTTSVKKTFENIFRREKVAAAYIEGDAFHRYNRVEMRTRMQEEGEKGNKTFSHFSPETNLFEELEKVFRDYGESGTGTTRHYVHDEDEAKLYGAAPGTFTAWGPLPEKCRPQDRRRARHQSGMDSEAASRPPGSRLHPGSRHRHHPAADA